MEHFESNSDPLDVGWPLSITASEDDAVLAVRYAKDQETWGARVRLVVEQQAVRVLSAGGGRSVRQIAKALGMSVGNVHRYGQAGTGVAAVAAPGSDAEARRSRETIRTAWGQVTDPEPPKDPTIRRQPAVAVSAHDFVFLTEMAAEAMARVTAGMIEHSGKFLAPGDPLGTILCLAWRGDSVYASLAFGAYFRALQDECDRRELECPTRERVVRTIELFTLNPDRFPDVDVSALVASLR